MNNMNFGRLTGNQMLPRRFADGGFNALTAPTSGASIYTHPGQSVSASGIPMPFSQDANYYARAQIPVQGDPATAAYRPGQLYFQYGAPQAPASPVTTAGGLPSNAATNTGGGLFDATANMFGGQGGDGSGSSADKTGKGVGDDGEGTTTDGPAPGGDGDGKETGGGKSGKGGFEISGKDIVGGLAGIAGGLLGGPVGGFVASQAAKALFDMVAKETVGPQSDDNGGYGADPTGEGGPGGQGMGVGKDGAGGPDPNAQARGGLIRKKMAQGGLAVVANQVRDASTVPGSGLAYLSPDMQRTVAQLKDPQMNPSSGVPQYARGGLSVAAHNGPGYVGEKEPMATGRADGVPAMLSNNEYVVDAETTALLGDGNPSAGAQKLDAMRANIRKHKGKALAKGKISQNAKPAQSYMGGLPTAKGGK